MTGELAVRALREADDFAQWRELYRGYAAFYETELSEAALQRVWSWLVDPAHEIQALVAVDGDGRLVGLAHYRAFTRPLSATIGCYLDDLFVEPSSRGTGAADLLLAELRRTAAAHGWSVVRWITADDNHRARSKYDQVAARTMWVTYDMAPGDPPSAKGHVATPSLVD